MESSTSQGTPTIHEMFQNSVSNPIVIRTASSSPSAASCSQGNNGMRTGSWRVPWRRRKLRWLSRMKIQTMIAPNSATPNR